MSRNQHAHLVGLDGLRGLAVVAVLLYHGGVLQGGFLGVEVFFVISGFLITTLLLEEWQRAGRIDLSAFWLRRARRLVPASWVVILAILTFSVLFSPNEVASLRGAAVAGLLSVSNWYFVFAQQSYFEAVGRPSLLRHLWSLGVEAQFYVVWPLMLGLGLRRWNARALAPLMLVGAAAAATLMGLLYQPEVDPSRLYYGTDTRASGLLLGAALALSGPPGRLFASARPVLLDGLGLGALGALAWLCVRLGELDPLLYRGGFALVGLMTAAVIGIGVHPRARLGTRVLAWHPLRWIGLRSYGIYLWHWPIFLVTRSGLNATLDGLPLLAVQVAGTCALAELSYRWVEMPVRTGGLDRAWRPRSGRGFRLVGLGAGLAMGLGLLGTSVAVARPPDRPAYLAVDSVDTWRGGVLAQSMDETVPASDESAQPREAEAEVAVAAVVAPAPEVVLNQADAPLPLRVTALGDSVMVGATPALERAIDGVEVDAALSRQTTTAIDILEERAAAGQLGDVVILHLGNNGTFTARQLDQIMTVLNHVPRVVLVNLRVPRAWEGPNNAVLADGVQRYANAVLVDWHAASSGQASLFWDDGMHLRPDGAEAYATLIAENLVSGR